MPDETPTVPPEREPHDLVVGGVDAETLLVPSDLDRRVSRSEVVNLMVSDYLDRSEAAEEKYRAEYAAIQGPLLADVRRIYELYVDEVSARVLPRLEAWRQATVDAVGADGKVSDLYVLAFTKDVDVGGSSVNARGVRNHRNDEDPALAVVFTRFLNDGVSDTVVSHYGSAPVRVAAFPVRAKFALIDGPLANGYGVDSEIVITVDATPRADIAAAIGDLMMRQRSAMGFYTAADNCKTGRDDATIKRLERKALALLTARVVQPDSLPMLTRVM